MMLAVIGSFVVYCKPQQVVSCCIAWEDRVGCDTMPYCRGLEVLVLKYFTLRGY